MIVKGLRLRKPCLWAVEKISGIRGVLLLPPILPYKYPYITIIIFFFIMKIFFHRVVIIGIEVLEMKELWRGQKSKNVEK